MQIIDAITIVRLSKTFIFNSFVAIAINAGNIKMVSIIVGRTIINRWQPMMTAGNMPDSNNIATSRSKITAKH